LPHDSRPFCLVFRGNALLSVKAKTPLKLIPAGNDHPQNIGGFLFGRALNYVIQLLFLHTMIWLHISEEWAGIIAIMLAGVINYFVLLPFFRQQKKEK
jgi:hypothetical protein